MAAHQDRTLSIELSDSPSADDELRPDDFLEQLRTPHSEIVKEEAKWKRAQKKKRAKKAS